MAEGKSDLALENPTSDKIHDLELSDGVRVYNGRYIRGSRVVVVEVIRLR